MALAGALLAISAAPAAAQMEVAVKVFEDYAADGRIDPCKHSSEDLRAVQKNIPPDVDQYAPDYPAAVAAAIEARARGECDGTKPTPAPAAVAPSATPAPTVTPVPTRVPTKKVVDAPPEPPRAPEATSTPTASADAALERAATATAGNGAPAPLLLLAILGALMLAGATFVAAARRFGWAEERLAGPAHAWREATWRTAGVWQDFRDWLRLGR